MIVSAQISATIPSPVIKTLRSVISQAPDVKCGLLD